MKRDPRSHRAAHVPRPGPKRRKAAAALEPAKPQYVEGHFTALIRKHDWPPRWEPMTRIDGGRNARGETMSEAASRRRDEALQQRREHALGTVQMANTPKLGPVRWMR